MADCNTQRCLVMRPEACAISASQVTRRRNHRFGPCMPALGNQLHCGNLWQSSSHSEPSILSHRNVHRLSTKRDARVYFPYRPEIARRLRDQVQTVTSIGEFIMSWRNCTIWSAFMLFLVVAMVTSPSSLSAQGQPAATAAPPTSPEIHAVLEKVVHPKKVSVGDAVTARLTESTKLKDGTELPKGTHIVGKVTEIKVKADKEGPSKLGILFDKAQMKDGKEVPLTMALVSVAPRWEPGGVDPVAADNGATQPGGCLRCHKPLEGPMAVLAATLSARGSECAVRHR